MSVCKTCGALGGLHKASCTGPRLAQLGAAPDVDAVNHPPHYGGEEDPYEAIKVIEAWGLGFHLGNTVKYISRAGKKSGATLLQDLKKARWYIDRKIKQLEASLK